MKTVFHTNQTEAHAANVGRKNEAFFQPVNSEFQPFFAPAAIQPKLEIGKPDDPFEKEADRVANAVVQMPDRSDSVQRQGMEEESQMKRKPILQRKCKECEGAEKLQRKRKVQAKSANRSGNASANPLFKATEVKSTYNKIEPTAMTHVQEAAGEPMIMGDWKAWIGNGELVNNSSRAVTVWSSDDGTYIIPAHSRSESWGEDVDHVRDINGQWWKIGWNTAVVDSNGAVSGAKCKSPGRGQDCGQLGDYPVPGVDTIHAKLKVNQPNDRFEQEADVMADKVVKSEASIQRKCAGCEEEEKLQRQPEEEKEKLQRKSVLQLKTASPDGENSTSTGMEQQINSSRGSGQPLPGHTRSFMENGIGVSFQEVKVHTDNNAVQMNRELGARAFTVGNDIYFNDGEYNPASKSGKHLLAHELIHVVQQGDHKIQRTIGDGHDLTSPRMSGNTLFEAVFDNEEVIEDGDSGQEVRRIQQMLIDLGIPMPTFGADGEFGAETKNAVMAFQRAHPPLVPDGRVGFATIEAIDNQFPAFALPANRSDPWTMTCILEILCPWNRNLVENILPSFTVKTFDSREFPIETWNGSSWDTSTFTSGGFRSGSTNTIGLLNSTTCEQMAFTIYHEGWHAQKPSSLSGVVEIELDAYVNAEQWSIDVGIPGQGTFVNETTGAPESFRTTSGGETVVNEPAAETFVRQEYGGVSSNPGERILSRVGASDVKVRRADGSEYVRPAQVGESVKGVPVMTNLQTIDPANWNCT